MPQTIAYAAQQAAAWVMATALNAGVSGSTAILLAKTAYFVTTTALTVASSMALTAAMAPTLPTPDSVLTPLTQARPPLRWGVGRMRCSGPAALWDTVPGWAVESRMIMEGRVDGFETVYLHDQVVTLKSDHFVEAIGEAFADNLVRIWFRPGRPTEIPTPELVAASGAKWTAAHRNDGIAAIDMMVKSVKQQYTTNSYPNGEPAVSVVTRLSRVFDWRDVTQVLTDPSTWKWSQNAILGYATWLWFGRYLESGRDDYVTPNANQLAAWAEEIAPALSFWTVAAAGCDDVIALKAGGSEPRYTVALMALSSDKEDTIHQAFLKACDGWTVRRSDGSRMIRIGKYINPTFEVTDASLIELNWERGVDASAKVNILEGSFLSTENDYTAQAIDPWIDEDAVAIEGEIRDTFDLAMVPSMPQARRLLKREMYRRRAGRRGSLTVNFSGLDIVDEGHRWIRVVRSAGPLSMRNVVLEITGEGKVDFEKLSVTFPVLLSGANIDSWFPALEEGFKPNETDRTLPDILPPPEILDVYASFQSDRAALVVVKIEDPDDDARTYQVSIIDSTGAAMDGPWSEADVVTGGLDLRAGPVGIGNYHATVRANVAGRLTEWVTPPVAVSVTHEAAPYFPPTYADGTDINELKPAEGGADVTGDHTANDTAHVGGRLTTEVLADLDTTGEELAREVLTRQLLDAKISALVYDGDGKSIKLVIIEAIDKSDNALAKLSLMGAVSGTGNAFVLDATKVMINGTTTLAQYLTQTSSTIAGNTSQVSILSEAVNGVTGKLQLSVSAPGGDGAIIIRAGAEGSVMAFSADEFYMFSDADPAVRKKVFGFDGALITLGADVRILGTLIVDDSIISDKFAPGALMGFASVRFGSHSNLGTIYTLPSIAFNPQGGRVRMSYSIRVDNPSTTRYAVRIKLFRDGANISGSMLFIGDDAFTTPCVDFEIDESFLTSTATWSATIQTVTGTGIGDTGGSAYNANLAGGKITLESFKKPAI